ncbi:ABC transporter ATP-binding protein [Streptomyces ficellus]|uniref:ABC transporter ATP-binding protein n=1 Tax=Streptomyces ficellus TaxID=1977088 RepID=A0ABT7Z2X7_9ACTN|nr:ABC transporter ATP-binding protein [Streptomyces ficellus]MDN3293850.1 ABC transporter ATP-binding protein [Streptomyces ficellus]
MRVDINDLSVEIAGNRLVHDITLAAEEGQVVGLVGPNGSGKSTVLRCAYRALRPAAGTVLLGGEDLHAMAARAGARRLAALPQESSAEFDFTVAEVVAMGRLPHQRGPGPGGGGLWGKALRGAGGSRGSGRSRGAGSGGTGSGSLGHASLDARRICADALARVGAAHLANQGFLTLSGGERQRVLIARALAQQPRVLVLDEPTNHLDIAHQLDVLALVRDAGLTVLAALHDLNLAAGHCDVLYVIARGRIVASGAPHDVLTPQLLADVFGVRAHRVRHPETGAVHLLFDRLDRHDHQERGTQP